jgi:hypothetical protein
MLVYEKVKPLSLSGPAVTQNPSCLELEHWYCILPLGVSTDSGQQ